jgi:hypothetical protein
VVKLASLCSGAILADLSLSALAPLRSGKGFFLVSASFTVIINSMSKHHDVATPLSKARPFFFLFLFRGAFDIAINKLHFSIDLGLRPT